MLIVIKAEIVYSIVHCILFYSNSYLCSVGIRSLFWFFRAFPELYTVCYCDVLFSLFVLDLSWNCLDIYLESVSGALFSC